MSIIGYTKGEPQNPVIFFFTGEEYLVRKYYGIITKKEGDKEVNYIDIDIERIEDYQEGVVRQPILITIDGNAFLVVQNNYEILKDIPNIKMELEPFEWVKSRLNLTNEDLDMSENGTIMGVLRRAYPFTSRVILSDNPEKPIWLLLTSVEGEKINWDNPSLAPLIEKKMELDRKDHRIAELEAEVNELREKNKNLVRITKEEKDEFQEIYGGEKIVFPAPPEFQGKRIKDGQVV